MRGTVKETFNKVKQVLERMDLTLHRGKGRVIDARKESFDFLGFTFCRKENFKTGKVITLVEPSRKSEQNFRDEVRDLTSRLTHRVGQDKVLKRVNRYVRGWANYFHLHNFTRVFCRQRFFLEQRMRKYLQSDDRSRGLGFAGGRQLNSTKSLVCTPSRNMPRTGALACVEMKMIGKPYAGELQVRFDEGEQAFVHGISKRARSWKQRIQPRIALTNVSPVLYSTNQSAQN